ncbi:transglutaminase-like cysteine peptidase [Mesorhizobium sp. M0323]|uniref:transglutaminase-like cysteine peptidase n=1 Tax=unclassified Mesorhizobium TaxID=325217 RepID=UPI003338FC89
MVRQSSGEGHAILSVNTTAGDFILDNLEPKVLLWSDTGYTYLKRVAIQLRPLGSDRIPTEHSRQRHEIISGR